MRLAFLKMHGTGNDFVLLDNRDRAFGTLPARDWAKLADRRRGIGCEGFILLEASASADFRMRFLNPDGSPAALCGNGTRCAARRAHALGLAPRRMTIETGAGPVDAEVLDADAVRIALPLDAERRWDLRLELDAGETIRGHWVVAGVPHFVAPVADAAAVDLARLGRAVRCHPEFAPDGTNVDFVSPAPSGGWILRTYERGVEAESGACGTGALAAAITLHERLDADLPLTFHCPSGERLRVDRAAAGAWRLEGAAAAVFFGETGLNGS